MYAMSLHQTCHSYDSHRCVAHPDDFDGGGHSRTCEHRDFVVDAFGPDTAWKDYGIIGNCVVISYHYLYPFALFLVSHSHLPMIFLERIYTNSSLLIYFTSSLKVYLRTISYNGFRITLSSLMAINGQMKSWTTLIAGKSLECHKWQ